MVVARSDLSSSAMFKFLDFSRLTNKVKRRYRNLIKFIMSRLAAAARESPAT
jgi:hypothetical protein